MKKMLLIACFWGVTVWGTPQVWAQVFTPGADNEIFFQNFENVFDSNGDFKGGPGTLLVVGDHIVGILNVQNIDANGLTVFFSSPENQLTGVFAQRVEAILGPPDPFDPGQLTEPHIVLGPPTVTTFRRGADEFSIGLSGNEMVALYRDVGPGATPFTSVGPMAGDVAKATDGVLWLTLGYDAGPNGTFGTVPDDDGYFYAHTDNNFPPPDRSFAGLNAIVNNTGFFFAGINDINEGEVGGSTLLNDVVMTSELETNPNGTFGGGKSPWETRSNDPATVRPVERDITIEKFTNGRDADDTNGSDDGLPPFTVGSTTVPTLVPGDPITWTYAVTNTGAVPFLNAEVVVTDQVLTLFNAGNPVPAYQIGAPNLSALPNAAILLAQLGGTFYDDGDEFLEPGEVWEFQALSNALNLSTFAPRTQDDPPDSPVVLGCDPDNVFDPDKSGYNNLGVVTVPGAEAEDPSNYCPEPGISIEKFTNGRDADGTNGTNDGLPPFTVGSTTVPTFEVGDPITWTYAVTNTGGVSYTDAEVMVTDEVLTIFSGGVPVRQVGAPNLSGLPNATALLAQLGGTFYDDGDGFLDPGEVWEYDASGNALDLTIFVPRLPGDPLSSSPTVLGCDPDDVFDPDKNGYSNVGVVTVPDDEDSDPSNYCPEPGISIEKFTNGRDADSTNGTDDGLLPFTVGSTTVPALNTGDPITWTYAVTNSGGFGYTEAEVTVTDEVLTLFNPGMPEPMRQVGAPTLSGLPNAAALLTQLGGTFYDDGDGILEPGEVWEYEAMGNLIDLTPFQPRLPGDLVSDSPAVLGCNPAQEPGDDFKGYNNVGVVTVPGDEDSDPSNICPEPDIAIEKFTNGRDADGTNGVDDGAPTFTVGSTTVPTLVVGAPIIWTYAVTNIGSAEFLQAQVEVNDAVLTKFNPGLPVPVRQVGAPNLSGLPNAAVLLAQLGGTFYDDGNGILAPGEVWEYQATGNALDLTIFAPRGVAEDPTDPSVSSPVVLGCNPAQIPGSDQNGYNNVGEVRVPGDEDTDPSDYCIEQPQCEIAVSKTCLVAEPPANPLTEKCAGKIQEWTIVWTGAQPISISGLPNDDADGVIQPGQEVTFFNPGGDANDVFVDIIGGGFDGQSKFHLSCSDKDMNADNDNEAQSQVSPVGQDCGKAQGNAKNNSDLSLINSWTLEGLVDADGLELDCTADGGSFPTETDQCVFTPEPEGKSCSDIKDITALTLVWEGPDGINITSELGQVINGINNGDVIVLDAPKDQTGNDVDVFISGALSGESRFHISCSDDDMNGPEDCGSSQGNGKDDNLSRINLWAFGGMTGEKGSFSCPGVPGGSDSAEVVYGISIENLSTEPVEVIITDANLGLTNADLGLPTPAPIGVGGSLDAVTDPFIITPDNSNVFKNTVVVSGATASGAMCEAMDMVEIKRVPPPEPPFVCSDAKPITSLTMVWDGIGPIDIVTEGGEMINGIENGDEVTFGTAGLGNDVDLTISGAVSGASRFHVSCSDQAMNGAEDCRTNQGNGKDDKANRINDWLLEGMAGDLTLDCSALP